MINEFNFKIPRIVEYNTNNLIQNLKVDNIFRIND